MPTDPQRAAAYRLYTSRKRDVAALLDWHAHAGDLGHVREKLVETLSFLAQREEKDIEDALADSSSPCVAGSAEQGAAAGREQARRKSTD